LNSAVQLLVICSILLFSNTVSNIFIHQVFSTTSDYHEAFCSGGIVGGNIYTRIYYTKKATNTRNKADKTNKFQQKQSQPVGGEAALKRDD